MIPLLLRGRGGIATVAYYGIYHAVQTFNAPDEDVARQVCYTFMNNDSKKRRCSLPAELHAFVSGFDLTEGFSDDEYRGFHGDTEFTPMTFEANDAIETLLHALKSTPKMMELAREFYRIRQGAELLGIIIPDIDSILQIHNKYIKYDDCKVFGQIRIQKIMKLYSEGALTEEQCVMLAAFVSLSSIKGKRTVAVTDKEHVLARMMGKVSPSEIDEDEIKFDPLLERVWKRYNNKEYWRRLTGMLRGGYVKFIQPLRDRQRLGTFFTFSRDMTEEEFVKAAEQLATERKKQKAVIRKRVERKRKRTNTFKPISIPKNAISTAAPQRQTNVGTQPFPPFNGKPGASAQMPFPPCSVPLPQDNVPAGSSATQKIPSGNKLPF